MWTHTTIVLYPSYTAPQEQCGCEHTLKYDTTISLIHWQFNPHPLALTQTTKWCTGHWWGCTGHRTLDSGLRTQHRTQYTGHWWRWTARPGAGSYWGNARVRSTPETRKAGQDYNNKANTHCAVFSSILYLTVWLNFVAALKEHMCWRERQDGCPPEQSKDTGHDTRQETPP